MPPPLLLKLIMLGTLVSGLWVTLWVWLYEKVVGPLVDKWRAK